MARRNYKGVPQHREITVDKNGTINPVNKLGGNPAFFPRFDIIGINRTARPSAVDYLRDVRTIYVRTDGDDLNGEGTAEFPFQTLSRAIKAVPSIFDEVDYVIDCTGISESLAHPLVWPVMYSAGGFEYVGEMGDLQPWSAPLRIQAAPTIVASITPTNQVLATTNSLLTIFDTTQVWTANQHKGRMAVGSGWDEIGVIVSNNTTSMEVAYTATMTAPVRIIEPGATITFSNASALGSSVFMQPFCKTLLYGIAFRHANTNIDASSFELDTGVAEVRALFCSFEGLSVERCRMVLNACWVKAGSSGRKNVYNIASELNYNYCLVDTCDLRQYGDGGSGFGGHYSTVFSVCGPVGHGGNNEPTYTFQMENLDIRNALGDGAQYLGGNRCSFSNTTISGSGGDAIDCSGPGMLELTNVQGSGNAQYGVRLQRGAAVRRLGSTAVTGSSGDLFVGASGTVGWSATPTSDIKATTLPQGCYVYI